MASKQAKTKKAGNPNNKTPANTRGYGWCFTIHNWSEDDIQTLRDIVEYECPKYMIWGKEICPTTGTPHLQGYIYFESARTFSSVLKKFGDIHPNMRKADGTGEQNRVYCSKEGDFEEHGEVPKDPKEGGKTKNLARWEDAREAAKKGKWDDIPADIYLRCYGTVHRIHEENLVKAAGTKDTEEPMEWYYGGSGTGKSRKAREENPDCFLKMCNKWWDNYKGQDVVIIEDFDLAHKVLCHHLKIWLDRYSFPAEVKGGGMTIRPKKIIITSNYHPKDIWSDERDLEPILRRLKITRFDHGGQQTVEDRFDPATFNGGRGADAHFVFPH